MKKGLFARKLGMTRIYDQEGNVIPVTALQVGPCTILGKRTIEKDGYSALRVGFDDANAFRLTKPELGLFKKMNLNPKKHLTEIRIDPKEAEKYEVGKELTLSQFKEGDVVDIQGRTKGKGFQGVVRRHHFHGYNETHGTHEYRRHPGSIGNREWPGHVWKGKKLPGQMGDAVRTTQNIKIAKIMAEKNIVLVRGSVPGAKNAIVKIDFAIKTKVKKQESK